MTSTRGSQLLRLPENVIEDLRRIHNVDKEERVEEAINILEDWLQKQDHILKKDYSKVYYEKTLLQCKGSVEKAKKQLDKLATMKTLLPKFFTATNARDDFKEIFKLAMLVPLPTLTKDLYRVLIIKYTNKHFDSDIFMEYYRFTMIFAEYLKAHDYLNGLLVFFDFRDVSVLDLATKLNLIELQQYLTILIEGYGCRLKGVYILTESKAVELLIKTVKQFISEKIMSRIHAISQVEDMHDIVTKEILPLEYGGNEKSVNKMWDDWLDVLSTPEHQEYMEMMNKAGTDESLRTSCKFNEDYMGMPGSFRQLSVD